MEPVTLTVGDLTLRPPAHDDFAPYAAAMADPQIYRWTLAPERFDAETWSRYVPAIADQWRNDSCYRWLVTDTASGDVLGMVGFLVHRHRTMEIVYWTMADARGRGVTERAARAAITWAFDEAKAARVTWDAIVGNHYSRLLAVKLGFTMIGRTRSSLEQRGDRVDLWTGEMLPGELRDTPADTYPVLRARALAYAGDQPVLATALADVRLRPMLPEDLDGITAASRDAETARWINVPVPYERSHAEGFLKQARNGWAAGTDAVWVIADGSGYAGTIALHPKPDLRSAETGFVSAPWARGKGYMTAALEAVCAYGFDTFLLERIVWRAFTGNDGSKRVAEKAGFTLEGVERGAMRFRGELRDCWIASRLKGDVR